ncbi:MAG: DnaD domain protein [Epulopiscium sp.]|nr:DnaD domain protein [Candidatus Epulonipiscium sp.]
MAILNIKNSLDLFTTPISNEFIDSYMPKANGNFVKVYLYGYRFCYHQKQTLTSKEMAERLDLLESDVINAFQYWKEQGLMEFEWNEDDTIYIVYQMPKTSNKEDFKKDLSKTIPENTNVHIRLETKPNYSPEELTIYMKNPEISRLFKIAERYLGRMLNHNDLRVLYSLYDWLRLPLDVIELVLEHCISNNHRSVRYIEKVAITWAEEGINTVEKAKNRMKIFNKDYRQIMKSFGLNRDPAPLEIELMDKWIKNLNTPMEIILEACKRTISQTQKPSFQYTDSIITSWNKNNVKTLEDIGILDNAYQQKKNMQIDISSNNTQNKAYYNKPSKFVNFKQREWDFEELERLEREYLKKELSGEG